MFIKIVQDLFRIRVFLQFDHDANTILIGFIADILDTFYFLFADQVCHAFDKRGFVYLIRDRVNNDIELPTLRLDNIGFTAHDDLTLAS